MPGHDPRVVASRLEEFRRNLLDVSLRNRLIHFRTRTKAGRPLEKVIEIFGEEPAELMRILVAEGKAMSFVGRPDPRPATLQAPHDDVHDYGDATSLAALRADAENELDTFVATGQPIADPTDLKLNTDETVSALSRKLTKIWRDARVALEEQGTNILFLALGRLVWFDPSTPDEERHAPLVMLPVSLERTQASAFRLRWDGGDPGGNLSIAAKLRAESGIVLPDLPEEPDLNAYFSEVAGAIRSHPTWRVDRNAVALGFLSYAKYLMYRDLAADGWPKTEAMAEHPVLAALLGDGFEESEGGIPEDAFLDPLRPAAEVNEVVDADGSQTLAILEARSGRSMIVEGPPGTGKSQTITNLIAELVGDGKKVLFIAEKAAALDVVYRRLQEANLGDACLELHSHKANKRSFYAELRQTESVAAPREIQTEADLRRLEADRAALNGYAEAVNAPVKGRGVSPRDAMGRLIELGPEPSPEGRYDFAAMADWNEETFRGHRDLVEALRAQIATMGAPRDHAFAGSKLERLLPSDRTDLADLLGKASAAIASARDSAGALAQTLRVEAPQRPEDLESLAEWTEYVLASPEVRGMDVDRDDWAELGPLLRDLVAKGRRLNTIRSKAAGRIPEATFDSDVEPLRARLHEPASLAALDGAAPAAAELADEGAALAATLGLRAPATLADLDALAVAGRRLGTAPGVRGLAVTDADWPTLGPEADETLAAVGRYQELRARYATILTEAAWGADVAVDLAAIETHAGSILRFLNGSYRSAMARTAPLFSAPTGDPTARAAALRAVGEAREAEKEVAVRRGKMATLFGERWQGLRSDVAALADASSWLQEAHAAVAAGRLPLPALKALERGAEPSSIGRTADRLRTALANVEAAVPALGLGDAEATYVWLRDRLRPASVHFRELGLDAAEVGYDETRRRLDEITEAQEARAALRTEAETASAMGARWAGEGTDWDEFEQALNWVTELHAAVDRAALPAGLLAFFGEDSPRGQLREAEARATANREAAAGAIRSFLARAEMAIEPTIIVESPYAAQAQTVGLWQDRLGDLPELVRFNALLSETRQRGLARAADLAESWSRAGERLVEAFERSWYEGVVREAMETRPALAGFDRKRHEATVDEFRRLDDLILRTNRAKVALAHWRSVPRLGAGGAIGWLKTQFELKQNHRPIRVAMERAGEAIQAIKPVFLMSPLSVAMYLPPNGPRFDVVIYDEASQVKPEDAFGGILRAAQTIVVGDSKQMPPTSFFDKLTAEEPTDEEDEDVASMRELESVLAMMSAKVPSRSSRRRDLRWHYRSRHDALIATSNRLFYDERLVVFPSPERAGEHTGLALRHDPSTVYGRGGSRKNPMEAKAVALAAQKHVRENPGTTLGIAAFSQAQQEAIEDELDILRRGDPVFAAFDAAHPFEPLFVKNLENVQGDERDVIFISVGYGRDENGFVSASFGPLNREGGERRLNVLITRARLRCEVFTNIRAEDVRLTENAPQGVAALKTFLQFAETGHLDVPAPSGLDPQSPFEIAVLDALRAKGYAVDPQVGSCGFYIDLAVRHPHVPGRYALGIECDGAMYHRARSARDRDKLRQDVLEARGWRIHRTWSTDWFLHPDRELDRLVQSIEASFQREPVAEASRPTEYVELERDATVKVEDEVPAYLLCDLQLGTEPLIDRPVRQLAGYVERVVQCESPVHSEEVARRIRDAAGARSSPRLNAALDAAIAEAEAKGTIRRSGEFLYAANGEVKVRSRAGLPAASRKAEYVAPEEIAAALLRVVETSFGIAPDEAIPLVAKRLGFERTSGTMTELVRSQIENALAEGRLREENGQLRHGIWTAAL